MRLRRRRRKKTNLVVAPWPLKRKSKRDSSRLATEADLLDRVEEAMESSVIAPCQTSNDKADGDVLCGAGPNGQGNECRYAIFSLQPRHAPKNSYLKSG
jgi:hypothetical protein